jgi:two-component system chemotaxis response regulator CheY
MRQSPTSRAEHFGVGCGNDGVRRQPNFTARLPVDRLNDEMKTILTVDDSASIRQMVAFTLSGAGYSVVQAVDGVDGLAKARTTSADLVLTDQNMPNADGLTLIRGLRALPAYAKTPILVLTTEAGDDMKAKGRAAGATGWIVKPFDPATLLNVVKKVLG